MAINIGYTPIQQALGLARQSGEGIRQQRQQQSDMEFIKLVQAAQARADQQYANEISTALSAQQDEARLNLAQQQLQANTDLRNRAMEMEAQQRQQQETAKAAQQQQQRQYVASQNNPQALAYFDATGKLPETVIPQNPKQTMPKDWKDDLELKAAEFELKRLDREITAKQRQIQSREQNVVLGPNDKDSVLETLQKEEQALRQQVDAQEARVLQRMQLLQQQSNITDLRPPPEVVRQIIQQTQPQQAATSQPLPQSAPDQQPRIVKTGTDRNTGRRVGLTEDGRLVFLN